jgi:hypothetical protein
MCSGNWSNVVDIFNATSRNWTTAVLSVSRSTSATSLPNEGLAFFAGGGRTGMGFATSNVDIFDARSGTWSTAVLSAPGVPMATSLPSSGLAIFAVVGGMLGCTGMMRGVLEGSTAMIEEMHVEPGSEFSRAFYRWQC